MEYKIDDVMEFIQHSNWIEREPSQEAFDDAMEAWELALTFDEITNTEVLAIHEVLMKRLNKRIAGKLRTCKVWVGGRECTPYSVVERMLRTWTQAWCKKGKTLTHGEIKKQHVNFEDIHPFEDGNGRTGRILMNWHCVKNNLPLIIIHEGAEQRKYYEWFTENK